MEQFILIPLTSLIKNLPAESPAYMDLLKLIAGSVLWFGGFIGFIYWKQSKLKPAVNK